jgi:hypothetical protein
VTFCYGRVGFMITASRAVDPASNDLGPVDSLPNDVALARAKQLGHAPVAATA